jgi:hypothetical protein
VRRPMNQLINVGLCGELREVCVIESCIVVHCGAE